MNNIDKDFIPGQSNDTHGEISAFCGINNAIGRVDDYVSATSQNILANLRGNPQEFLSSVGHKNSEKVLNELEQTTGKITILDMYRMPNVSDNDIFKIINNILGRNALDIDDGELVLSQDGIKKINNLLNDSKDFYENELFRSVPRNFIPGKGTRFNFSTTQEIVDFVKETGTSRSGAIRQIRCNLFKIAYILNQVQNEPRLANGDVVFREILEDHILTKFASIKKDGHTFDRTKMKLLKIKDIENFNFYTQHTQEDGLPIENISEIVFSNTGREKTGASASIKLGYRSKYSEIDLINDYFGLQSQVKTPQDAVLLLQYLYYNVFNKNIEELGNKGLIDFDLINSMRHQLTDEFYNLLIKEFDLNKKQHSEGHNAKRNNTDIVGYICHKNVTHPIERQIWLVNNKNNTGFQHHVVYEGFKKIAFMIRLQGYVSKSYIRRVARMQIQQNLEKYPEILNIGGGDLQKTINRIVDYYTISQGEILEFNVPGVNVPFKYYTTKDRRDKLAGTEFYPSQTSVLDDGKRRIKDINSKSKKKKKSKK